MHNDRKRICEAFNINQNELYSRFVEAWCSPQKTRILEDGVVKETTEKPDLAKIPILTHFEKMLARALRQQSFMQKALTLIAP
ncbi:MAG: UbiD family decarboxylase [Candidatus Bathyarchaeota archaeon]|nr:UbiD family decarboxylase [Candidatus Bathyarchaeota archaeon]